MKLPKIISKEEKEAKEKRRNRMMTVLIVFILLASTAAFALTSDQTEKESYKGLTFLKTENGWNLKNSDILTTLLPSDVENISSPWITANDFKNNIFYVAMTSAEQAVANELNRAFYNSIEKAQLACSPKYENESFCSELPIKDCMNASSSELIIDIEESENQSISFSDNCLSIKGNEADLIKSADRIIFSAYGIIK